MRFSGSLLTVPLLLLVLLPLLAGCYITKPPVLTAANSEELPWLLGSWVAHPRAGEIVDRPPAGTLRVEAMGGGREYQVYDEEGTTNLMLRGFNVIGDVFVLEAVDANAPTKGSVLLFCRLAGDTLYLLLPDADVHGLARATGVSMGETATAAYGAQAAMLSFLRAHSQIPFAEHPVLLRAQ